LISRKENPLESRRVRTHPLTRMLSISVARFKAALMSVRCMRPIPRGVV